MNPHEEITYPQFQFLLNTAPVSATMVADDFLVRMAYCGEGFPGPFILEVVDTSDLPEDHKRLSRYITSQEAAAISALFITAEGDLEKAAYAVLESTFAGVPNNLRPIP